MTETKSPYFEEVELGDEIGPLEKDITDDAVLAFCKIYTSCTPNRFTDEQIAKEVGLPEPIIPGVMSMAMMAQLLTVWAPEGSLKHLDVVFRQPVFHRPIAISAVVTDKREEDGVHLVECDVYLSDEERGRLVGGRAVMALPSRDG
jgi:acyl dehydratase